MSELTDLKNKNKLSIDKLNDNVDRLNQICNDQDQSLKNLEFEKTQLQKRNDDLNYDNNNNLAKIRSTQESLNFTKNELDDANKKITHQQVKEEFLNLIE